MWIEWYLDGEGSLEVWSLYLFITGRQEQVAERSGVIAPYDDLATQERYEQELVDSYILPF